MLEHVEKHGQLGRVQGQVSLIFEQHVGHGLKAGARGIAPLLENLARSCRFRIRFVIAYSVNGYICFSTTGYSVAFSPRALTLAEMFSFCANGD
jgi:hypothetical protein